MNQEDFSDFKNIQRQLGEQPPESAVDLEVEDAPAPVVENSEQ